MKTDKVLKEVLTGPYAGYQLQNIYEHGTRPPLIWEGCRKLLRIPHKITYFFNRNLIVEVRKTTWHEDPTDERYFLKLTDGTYLEAEY